MRILIAGELNVDLVLQNYHSFPSLGREVLVDDVSLTLGSASAIGAAGLARLGNQVAFAGKLGCDSWGDLCMDSLAKLGIDTSLVLRDSAIKTGITVSIASARDRALVTYLGSIGALQTADIPKEKLRDYRHLHISSFFLQQALRPDVKSMLAAAHGYGVTTSLDPGFDPAEEWGRDLLDVLTEVDIFLPNELELERITRRTDCIEGLRALQNGRTVTVAKLGAAGCLTLQNGGPLCISSFPVSAIDTTGAGDSFNAGFLHAWLRRQPLAEAMRFGAACGALSTQGLGGVATQATEAQAIEFIAGNS